MDNRNIFFLNNWYSNEWNFSIDLSNTWMNNRISKITYNYILKYAFNILVPNFKFTSVFGFSLLINMITQMWSGFLLALYYVPDPTLVMTFREEYINEIWWFFYVYKIHVIGVDSIFVLSYLHILKKIYIKNYIGTPIQGWTTGTYAFLVYHVVVFLGITLSSNHLGDLTLTIGASIFWSIFLSKHKIYAPIFTNKHLNTEQLTRFMIAHYLVAWYYIYLVQTHVMFIHEMWDLDSGITEPQETNTPKGSWIWDALQKEASSMLFIYTILMTKFIKDGHPDSRVVNFNFFEQWSEVEVEDINFFIVGPHWYFRPHMGLLTVCAQHYEGLFWLVFYYVSLTLLPVWSRIINLGFNSLKSLVISLPTKDSKIQKITFLIFVLSLAYVGGTLPCARFYYADDEGFFGNSLLRLSYQYLYIYLIFIVHYVDKIEKRVCTIAVAKKNKKKKRKQ